jgi:hypothetical protein
MFQLSRQIAGETRLWLSEFLFRIQLSIKRKHWLNHKEYLETLMDETRRGN